MPASPLKLRAHTLLCLQGFRGEGYDPGFVENFAEMHEHLRNDPALLVEVVDGPDVVCACCPHLRTSGCTLRGEDFEREMQAQDRHVLRLLGLRAGDVTTWGDILRRIRQGIAGTDLPTICGECRWLPLGYCREGIERLRTMTIEPAESGSIPRRDL